MTNKSAKGTLITHIAGFVNSVNGISIVNNCTNNIDIDGSEFTSGDAYIGGIVRDVLTGYSIISNCINNGNITSLFRTAGIVSLATNSSTLLLENNLNTGIIKSTSTSSNVNANAGGILAYLEFGTVTLKNNTNLGNIENNNPNANAGVGGIIGSMYHATYSQTAFLYNNTNSGNITANATTEGNAGGIIGSTNGTASLFNNTNTGTVT